MALCDASMQKEKRQKKEKRKKKKRREVEHLVV
jgi:hypothetical protein